MLVLGSWLLPSLLCPSGCVLGGRCFLGEAREKKLGMETWVWVGLPEMHAEQFFHSGLVPGIQEGKLPALLFSVLLSRYTLLVVISVAQPSSYRFQGLNT